MISAANFATGAQQLGALLAAAGGGGATWQWQPIRSAFDRGPVDLSSAKP